MGANFHATAAQKTTRTVEDRVYPAIEATPGFVARQLFGENVLDQLDEKKSKKKKKKKKKK